ncbi:hypothetical protein ACIU1J_26490 [Azospirillum doebereinerae]|uniref:hypothetical protein n=1 Tax=Azospirillum doebereinerae TaxID=92933 RepID=UPI001EE59BAA|nr:hypothetical protein [Azospirillum doebereinerae]MCG5243626.1 hypothetical protein [Azospirillum doebereinerae]
MDFSRTLVVPMDVRAFCVGTGDASAVDGFSGLTLDFSRLTPADDDQGAAIIGRNNQVNRDNGFPPRAALEPGVHLHWNLPRAFTHGRTDEATGDIAFPVVPNRWLVTRLPDTDDPFQHARSWVVESDHVSETPTDGLPADTTASVTLFTGYDHPQPYRYLGRAVPADGWVEPGGSRLKQLTLSDLTVMQTGDPLFASFYPDCRNVFGLHDDLSDAGDALEGKRILYVVAGWYSVPANDPLQAHDASAQPSGDPPPSPEEVFAGLLDRLRWTLPDGVSGIFDRLLVVGQVQGVVWNKDKAFVPSDAPIEVTLGLGGNGAEALSALLGGTVTDPQERASFETLLSAYQLGVISALHEPHPDRMTELQDKLHGAGFTHTRGGTIWTCVQDDAAQHPVPQTDLPASLLDALAALNQAQAAYDAADAGIDATRRHLHLDWYRYGSLKVDSDAGTAEGDDLNRLGNIATYIKIAIPLLLDEDNGTEVTALRAATSTLAAKKDTAAKAAAANGWVLKALNAPWYWRPNDPVVGLSGPELRHRLQGIDAADLILCRPVTDLLRGLTIAGQRLDPPAGRTPPVDAVPQAVWDEAVLLDAAWVHRKTGSDLSDVETALQAFLAGDQHTGLGTAPDGVPPVSAAVQWWDGGNPWLPLFLWWTANYYPAPGYDGYMQDVPADYVTGNFSLTKDGALVPKSGVLDHTKNWAVDGRAILTPLLARQIERSLSADQADPDLQADVAAVRKYLEDNPTLYQGLSGFTDALLMLGQIPQLVSDTVDGVDSGGGEINLDDGLFHRVSAHVGHSLRSASYPNNNFVPLRAGSVAMEVTLVDVFGRRRQGVQQSFRCAPPLHLDQEEGAKRAYLPPRFSQAVRLTFDFLSPTDTVERSLLVSPVCGWLMPNHLDDALMVYDTGGRPLGMLDLLTDRVQWMGVPGPTYGENLDTAMQSANRHLRALVRALHDGDHAGLAALLTAVNAVQASTTGSIVQDPGLSRLIGRPVALVQTTLSLDLLGTPAVNQSWEAFDADYDAADEGKPDSFIGQRTHNGITGVEVEVMLGGADRFRDGVLGFFLQTGDGQGYDFTRFHSPAEGTGVLPARITLSIDRKPVRLLMLVDPLADLHAVTGLLPTQRLTIPPDWTVPVLDALSVTFPVRPVLAAAANFDLPLPAVGGYAWSWVQHQGDQWASLPVGTPPSAAAKPYVPQRVHSGWLKLARTNDQA